MVLFTSGKDQIVTLWSFSGPLRVGGWKVKGQGQGHDNAEIVFFALSPLQIIRFTSRNDQVVHRQYLYRCAAFWSRSQI